MFPPNIRRVVLWTALAWAAGMYLLPTVTWLVFDVVQRTFNLYNALYSFSWLLFLVITPMIAGAAAGGLMAVVWRRFPSVPRLGVHTGVLTWTFALFVYAFFDSLVNRLIQPPVPLQPLPGETEPAASIAPFVLVLALQAAVAWLVPGLLGGLLLALELNRPREKRWPGPAARIAAAKIAAGWGIGLAVGAALASVVMNLLHYLVLRDFLYPPLLSMLLGWMNFGIVGLVGGALGAWVTLRVVHATAAAPEPAAQTVPGL